MVCISHSRAIKTFCLKCQKRKSLKFVSPNLQMYQIVPLLFIHVYTWKRVMHHQTDHVLISRHKFIFLNHVYTSNRMNTLSEITIAIQVTCTAQVAHAHDKPSMLCCESIIIQIILALGYLLLSTMARRRLSDGERWCIIGMIEAGMSCRVVGQQLGYHHSMVSRLVQK